jgi:hypothetical protein
MLGRFYHKHVKKHSGKNDAKKTEVSRKVKEGECRSVTLDHDTNPDALDKTRVLELKSAEFDNLNMELSHFVSEPTMFDKYNRVMRTEPLYKIPKHDYNNIGGFVSPHRIILKLFAPDVSAAMQPECIHFMKLEFYGFLFKLKEYQTIETIDIMSKGKHIETIERTSNCISLNGVLLDAFLTKHLDMPNVKAILDYYQTTYSKPKDQVIWQEPVNSLRP